VRTVAVERGRWLAEHGVGPMRFYCWCDDQARQLRFSLVSAGPSLLPFRCLVEPAAELGVQPVTSWPRMPSYRRPRCRYGSP
jgi:hypothetical protein